MQKEQVHQLHNTPTTGYQILLSFLATDSPSQEEQLILTHAGAPLVAMCLNFVFVKSTIPYHAFFVILSLPFR